jgi:hypothetical protein
VEEARGRIANAADEKARREMQCVAESWEGIATHAEAEIELLRKRQAN